jgi:Caspase domain
LITLLAFAAILVIEPLIAPLFAEEMPTRRIALIVGSHDGGKGRARLSYAGTDAKAFAKTLEDLGGLERKHRTLLLDPDSASLLRAFAELSGQARSLREAGARTEAVVYYSGHADDQGLLLGRERLSYRTFRNRMDALGSDVRIAIVDACASGALTRLKGGKQVPAFLVDKSTRSEGYAILTSSSESEAAQESDRIGGSFFTHALTSGLRGGGDASQDGKVTLHEAYQFAYQETLARTETTQAGPQHAGYDMRLSGTGDVVLTDLRQASAYLELEEELHGRIFVRDSANHLAVELQKPAGRPMRIGLEPGRYGLRLFREGTWHEARATLSPEKPAQVGPAAFRLSPGEPTVSRGGGKVNDSRLGESRRPLRTGTQFAVVAANTSGDLQGRQLSLAFNRVGGHLRGQQVSLLGVNSVGETLQGMQVMLVGFNFALDAVHGGQASGLFNIAADSVVGGQGSTLFNIAGHDLSGGQGAAIFNVAAGQVTGGQGAAVFNVAGRGMKGFQGAAVFNATGGAVQGAQAAAVLNVAWGDIRGGQGSAVLNVAGGHVSGVQAAAVANIAGQGVTGFQGAAVMNAGFGTTRGAQAAAVLNVSGDVVGTQAAAVLNVAAHVEGHQVGLVNLSKSYGKGFPVGLVNISLGGSFHAITWVDETGMGYVGLRTGVNRAYSLLAIGRMHKFDRGFSRTTERDLFAPTVGMGYSQPLPHRFALEIDALQSAVFAFKPFTDDEWSRLRVGLVYRPVKHVECFAGAAYNIAVHPDGDAPSVGSGYPWTQTAGHSVTFWPGAFMGLRLGT